MNRRIRIILLISFCGALIYGGWMPMNFQAGSPSAEFSEAFSMWQLTPDKIVTSSDVQLNILIFMPIGLLAGWIWGAGPGALLAAAGISAAVSLSIETGQLYLPDRFCSMRDVITNVLGGCAGWTMGLLFFTQALRRRWRQLAGWLGGKYGLMGAAAISLGLLARAVWSLQLSGSVLRENVAFLARSPMGDPARFAGARWLTLGVLPYLAITLLLSSRRRERELSDGRIFAAGACALGVLGICEILRLLSGAGSIETTGLAALLLGWMGVAMAIPLAPVLHRRRVELPETVLAAEIVLALLLARVAWSASGGGTAWPLWGLYRHEFAWGYFALARRLAFMSLVGFMGAFYLSLKFAWPLHRRAALAALAAITAATVIELARFVAGGRVNTAGLLENSAAAVLGTLLFAMTWGYLDRRKGRKDRRQASPRPGGNDRRSMRPSP